MGMIFGKSHRYAVVLALSALLIVPLVGCGGGDGGDPPASPTPDPSKLAVLTGRVVDSYNGDQSVAGAVVSFNGVNTASDVNGNFSLKAPATGGTLYATVVGPSNNFYNSATVNGVAVNVVSPGIAVGATAEGQTRNLGVIKLFSKDGPPPPPPLD
ncbi:hypothetical protein [Armatimonas rosea]|uniref:Carboxypeptidase regulatory-like domain-containing protein n=1 Tax=Armatimonas rosea TaxID=685828 RepID=A0A7W9SLT5_ARMRO|nr:hypothetical protein [Armatimonas rosea]MBB6049012.1 hypothetical protein [Armatimonas rosea]